MIISKNSIVFRSISTLVLIGICITTIIPMAGAGTASAPGIANFPASYQPALQALQAKYPNWQFVALNTNLDWATVIKNQTPAYPNNRSLVPASWDAPMKDTSYTAQIEPGWVRASEGAVKYYMDPRNWLDEKSVFQFELLSYNSSVHKLSGVQSIVNGTFMTTYPDKIVYTNTSGGSSTITKSYAQAILDAGVTNKVSPYYLASKIRQEVVLGGGGPSDSVSGKVPGYVGIYNFYCIGATAGANPVLNGLNWAKNSANGYGTPWTDPVKSINGGAGWIAKGYINVGQDTVYLQKYNVSPSDPSQLYWHQYMTNIAGAVSEGQKLYNGYASIGALSQTKLFYIPVYKNMPATSCNRPSGFPDSDPNIYTVNTSGVNIRTGPGTAYSSLGLLSEGTAVRVLTLNHSAANGYTWAYVELANGTIGYIANVFLTKRAVTPSETLTPYSCTRPSIVYTGAWSTPVSPVYLSGTARSTNQLDARVYFNFTGSGIDFYGAKIPKGGRFEVYLDGVYQKTVNTYAATATYRVKLYSVRGLDPTKTHELMLVNIKKTDGTPGILRVDRFFVCNGKIAPATLPAASVTPLQLTQPETSTVEVVDVVLETSDMQ